MGAQRMRAAGERPGRARLPLHQRGAPPAAHRRMARVAAAAGAAAAASAPPPAPAQREVWRISAQGAVTNLRLESEPVPQLAPGQALVAVRCVGLNFADVFCCLVSATHTHDRAAQAVWQG